MGAAESAPEIQYSIPTKDFKSATAGGPAYRHPDAAEGFLDAITPGFGTLYHNFKHGADVDGGSGRCLGSRNTAAGGGVGNGGPYVFINYRDAYAKSVSIGKGFVEMGLASPADKAVQDLNQVPGSCMIGLFSQNCAEWVLAEQGCNSQSIATVPLYDTLGHDAVEFIIKHTGLTTVVCSPAKLKITLSIVGCSLKNIVVMGAVDQATKQANPDFNIVSLDDVEAAGKASSRAICPPEPHMLATICFTSGTTGNPKGAMLSHRNIIADAAGAVGAGVKLYNDDVHISYLPLAHMFERCVQVALLHAGAAIGFFRGDVLKLTEDLQELTPTIFPSVPRLFNRIFDKINDGARQAGGIKAGMFEMAVNSKKAGLKSGFVEHGLWDKIVFSKVKARLGGKVRLMVTGSAPIKAEVLDFLRLAFACPVIEGYGQTECGAAATLSRVRDVTSGHVGGPMPCNEVRLCDVPEMNYLSSSNPPRGEVCFRGPNVFSGYYKAPEQTAEALDSEGWLHSGDIGEWLPNGALRIIDRKKNIFKLSQGEYVAAEKIENTYTACPLIAQAFVYGDSLQSVLVAVIVPDADIAKQWAAENGIPEEGQMAALCGSAKFKAAVMEQMKSAGSSAKLKGFEVVRDIHLESELFSVDNDLLTPTFKLKRPQAKTKYQKQIAEMYRVLNEAEAAKPQTAGAL